MVDIDLNDNDDQPGPSSRTRYYHGGNDEVYVFPSTTNFVILKVLQHFVSEYHFYEILETTVTKAVIVSLKINFRNYKKEKILDISEAPPGEPISLRPDKLEQKIVDNKLLPGSSTTNTRDYNSPTAQEKKDYIYLKTNIHESFD